MSSRQFTSEVWQTVATLFVNAGKQVNTNANEIVVCVVTTKRLFSL